MVKFGTRSISGHLLYSVCILQTLVQALSRCARLFGSKDPGNEPGSKLSMELELESCNCPGTEIWVIQGCPLSHPRSTAQTLMRLAGQPGAQ